MNTLVNTQVSTSPTRAVSTGAALRRSRLSRLAGPLFAIASLLPLLLLLLPASASARIHHNDAWARKEFAKAERMREALNGRPAGQRTRREYQRAIDSYRGVYLGSPASSKADPSVVATAELMVEMGRRFDDNKILRGAVEQYRFLRKEYPGSKYRFDALFTIAEIYKDDLEDPQEARTTFEDFVRRYPRNHLADDARDAIKELDAEAEEAEHPAKSARGRSSSSASSSGSPNGSSGNAASASSTGNAGPNGDAANETASGARDRRNTLPRVTGIRHWSTPDYTRVAIDVERDVKFGSQRISGPDRIFFDLRDTTLASTLVGKTFDVDDGFLKKIRVAEFKPGRTRIVLEVDNLASYDAFLLPDPYRLIIDVHGKATHGGRDRATLMARADSETAPGFATPGRQQNLDANKNSAGAGAQSAKRGAVETDLPAGDGDISDESKVETSGRNRNSDTRSDTRSDSAPSEKGVIKTTVTVKGSNRKIPKTIVPADDGTTKQVPATVASERENRTGHGTTTDRSRAGGNSTPSDSADASPPSSSSPHRRKSRSTSSSASATLSDSADADGLDANARSAPRDSSREARPTASGDRSLTRALGLKIGKIVIDAGHGGHDAGTVGPTGLQEKDVCLDVAKRLGRLLESRLGAEVVYTRRDDTFIPLETRTAIANRERADLFISIHANSSRDPDARGVETYYLNFTSSPEALEVAARENAVSDTSIHELQDLVKKIALKEKIDESREFAGDVQESLYDGLAPNSSGMRDRGIKKAPFIVLIGANMPSILAEISFVSNPTDERRMGNSEHRQRIAESLYRGVSKYVNGLSGVKVASRIEKREGQ